MSSRQAAAWAAACVVAVLLATPAVAGCREPGAALGVARVVEIDTAGGPIFGALTTQAREARFLAPKEVVLTFDDGPMPGVTRSILDTLERFCTQATFFSVGRMALAYPALTREIVERGHTLGTHTWSHPMNLPRMGLDRARDQIETGFAAVALAAGTPIAPFFRFPGLSDSPALLDYLQHRGIAAFTVDVVSNDSYISDPGRLIARTLQHAHDQNGGILLFHDIKLVTARALPTILRELKVRGFAVVHLRAKAPHMPDERSIAAVREQVQRTARSREPALLAVTAGLSASLHPAPAALGVRDGARPSDGGPPVTSIAPEPRDRLAKKMPHPDDVALNAPARQPAPARSPPRAERAKPASLPSPWENGWRWLMQGG